MTNLLQLLFLDHPLRTQVSQDDDTMYLSNLTVGQEQQGDTDNSQLPLQKFYPPPTAGHHPSDYPPSGYPPSPYPPPNTSSGPSPSPYGTPQQSEAGGKNPFGDTTNLNGSNPFAVDTKGLNTSTGIPKANPFYSIPPSSTPDGGTVGSNVAPPPNSYSAYPTNPSVFQQYPPSSTTSQPQFTGSSANNIPYPCNNTSTSSSSFPTSNNSNASSYPHSPYSYYPSPNLDTTNNSSYTSSTPGSGYPPYLLPSNDKPLSYAPDSKTTSSSGYPPSFLPPSEAYGANMASPFGVPDPKAVSGGGYPSNYHPPTVSEYPNLYQGNDISKPTYPSPNNPAPAPSPFQPSDLYGVNSNPHGNQPVHPSSVSGSSGPSGHSYLPDPSQSNPYAVPPYPYPASATSNPTSPPLSPSPYGTQPSGTVPPFGQPNTNPASFPYGSQPNSNHNSTPGTILFGNSNLASNPYGPPNSSPYSVPNSSGTAPSSPFGASPTNPNSPFGVPNSSSSMPYGNPNTPPNYNNPNVPPNPILPPSSGTYPTSGSNSLASNYNPATTMTPPQSYGSNPTANASSTPIHALAPTSSSLCPSDYQFYWYDNVGGWVAYPADANAELAKGTFSLLTTH